MALGLHCTYKADGGLMFILMVMCGALHCEPMYEAVLERPTLAQCRKAGRKHWKEKRQTWFCVRKLYD